MRSRRFFFFFLAILLGVGAGLAIGWIWFPPRVPTNADLTGLRVDFKTDLVLMTAEQFQDNPDPNFALDELAKISKRDPLTLLNESIQYAEEIGYQESDLELMQLMFSSIDAQTYQAWKAEQRK